MQSARLRLKVIYILQYIVHVWEWCIALTNMTPSFFFFTFSEVQMSRPPAHPKGWAPVPSVTSPPMSFRPATPTRHSPVHRLPPPYIPCPTPMKLATTTSSPLAAAPQPYGYQSPVSASHVTIRIPLVRLSGLSVRVSLYKRKTTTCRTSRTIGMMDDENPTHWGIARNGFRNNNWNERSNRISKTRRLLGWISESTDLFAFFQSTHDLIAKRIRKTRFRVTFESSAVVGGRTEQGKNGHGQGLQHRGQTDRLKRGKGGEMFDGGGQFKSGTTRRRWPQWSAGHVFLIGSFEFNSDRDRPTVCPQCPSPHERAHGCGRPREFVVLEAPSPRQWWSDDEEPATADGRSTAEIIASQSQDYVDEKLAEYQATIYMLQGTRDDSTGGGLELCGAGRPQVFV